MSGHVFMPGPDMATEGERGIAVRPNAGLSKGHNRAPGPTTAEGKRSGRPTALEL